MSGRPGRPGSRGVGEAGEAGEPRRRGPGVREAALVPARPPCAGRRGDWLQEGLGERPRVSTAGLCLRDGVVTRTGAFIVPERVALCNRYTRFVLPRQETPCSRAGL